MKIKESQINIFIILSFTILGVSLWISDCNNMIPLVTFSMTIYSIIRFYILYKKGKMEHVFTNSKTDEEKKIRVQKSINISLLYTTTLVLIGYLLNNYTVFKSAGTVLMLFPLFLESLLVLLINKHNK